MPSLYGERPPSPALIAWLAFALAFAFGAIANRVNFCTMGAVTDVVHVGDWRRMRMWLLAIAVAIVGVAALEAAGQVDFGKTIYTTSRVPWVSCIVGGFLFGFGMTLASGCGSKTLIRIGAGNLKSLVVLIMLGISAYMTLKGLFAVLRVNALDPFRFDTATFGAARSDLPSVVAALAGGGSAIRIGVALVFAVAVAAFVLASRDFRASGAMIAGGIVIGAIVVGGWYVSGPSGLRRRGPENAGGGIRRDQFGQGRVVLLCRAGRLPARTPDAVERPVPNRYLRRRGGAGHACRVGRDGAGHADLPLGGVCVDRRSGQPFGGWGVNGIWRRHGARVYDWPGSDRNLHAGAWVMPRAGAGSSRVALRR